MTLSQPYLFNSEKARLLSHQSHERNLTLMSTYTSICSKISLPKLKNGLVTVAPTLILAGVLALVLSSDALAMKEDSMKEGLTKLEGFLTGNFTRLMVLGGAVFGAFHAFMKQQPALLLGALATGLGINFLQSWLEKSWTLML